MLAQTRPHLAGKPQRGVQRRRACRKAVERAKPIEVPRGGPLGRKSGWARLPDRVWPFSETGAATCLCRDLLAIALTATASAAINHCQDHILVCSASDGCRADAIAGGDERSFIGMQPLMREGDERNCDPCC
jgi:hypothetical protein